MRRLASKQGMEPSRRAALKGISALFIAPSLAKPRKSQGVSGLKILKMR